MAYQLTELQEKWLTALESGEYAQCKGSLHRGAGYCCLGVLCVVSGREFNEQGFCEERNQVLPSSVREESRLRDSSGESLATFHIGDMRFSQLTEANDSGHTFAQIAAAIRANPENFFLPNEVAP